MSILKVLSTFTLLIGFATTVHSGVPHTFNNGFPALAKEVNANFASLNEAIEDIATAQIAAAEKNEETNCQPDLHPITYEHKDSVLGEVVATSGGGTEYKMTLIPFVDFATGERYTIKLPLGYAVGGRGGSSIYITHTNIEYDCTAHSINGFPMLIRSSGFYPIYVGYEYNTFYKTVEISPYMSYSISIKINTTTRLSFSYRIGLDVTELDKNAVDLNFDLTSIEDSAFEHNNTGIERIDNLIDYIEIVKVIK